VTQGEMKRCRTCTELVGKNGECRHGCDQYTAVPHGTAYQNDHGFVKTDDGSVIEYGGAAGNLRRMPTCHE